MSRLCFTICKKLALLSLAAGILTLYAYGPEPIQEARAADDYSAPEKVYLKNITPSLYEFSQIAALVSESVLTLQSSPGKECTNQFAYYGGLIASFKKQLSAFDVPPRMESIHRNSLKSLDDYETALSLYREACIEEDYGFKESLVSRGGNYINESVGRIGRVYAEIEALRTSSVLAQPEQEKKLMEEAALFEDSLEIAAGKGVLEEGDTAGDLKTRQEVIEEISQRVESEKQAPVSKPTQSPLYERGVSEVASPEYQEPKTATPEIAVPPSETQETALREIASPAPVSDAGDAGEIIVSNIEDEDPAKKIDTKTDENESIALREKKSDEADRVEKIKRMNQIIMSRSTEGQTVPEEKMMGRETLSSVDDKTAPTGIAVSSPRSFESGAAVAPAPPNEITTWCMSRLYSEDEIANCIRSRTEAKDNVESMVKAFPDGTEGRKILDKCKSDWTEGATYNYEMVVSCVQFFCTRKGISNCVQMAK